jgi:ribosome-binding protein aMBF1 (putative translation factor)
MSLLEVPSEKEAVMAAELREAVLEEIKNQGWSSEDVAERLKMFPVGVEFLLSEKYWPVETAIRIAAALGINIVLTSDVGLGT